MNISEVKELIKAVSESDLTAFDYEEGNIRMCLRKGGNGTVMYEQEPEDRKKQEKVYLSKEDKAESPDDEIKGEPWQEEKGNIVKSPLVGTVYLAPEEGAEPFVKVGDTVEKGQTLAIVEAMKLMNEIESDFEGVVKKVLVDNAKPVEYGQPLFIIDA